MRRSQHFEATPEEARALFARLPVFHLAGSSPAGRPVLRSLHGVVLEGALYWHAAPVGEKDGLDGLEVTVGVEEVIAEIPSHFLDPDNACPATTLYRSAQSTGTVRFVHDPEEKAAALQGLMTKLQPEGRHVPIAADDPRYRAAVNGIRIAKVPLDGAVAKHKLAQNFGPQQAGLLIAGLWSRGTPADLRAIEVLRGLHPQAELPASMALPAGLRSSVAPGEAEADQVADLLEGQYWTIGLGREGVRQAQLRSAAWVVLLGEDGRVVASARAITDGFRFGYILDVIVHGKRRGAGLGTRVMELLLDHPAVRGVGRLCLRTRDAGSFYRPLGFRPGGDPDMALPFPSEFLVRKGSRDGSQSHSARLNA